MRRMEHSDAENVLRYRADPVANRFQGWVPGSIDDVHEFMDTRVSPVFDKTGTWSQLVIILSAEKRIIGDVGVHFLEPDGRQVELGYTLDKNYQGMGFATEALKGIIGYLFCHMGKHRIIFSMDPRNDRSVAMAERLGLRKEALFRQSIFFKGEWTDDLVYGILKEEWKET